MKSVSSKWIFTLFLIIMLGGGLMSCTGDAEKLVGSWSDTFSMTDDYTQYRVFQQSERKYSFFHTFQFNKGKDKNGGHFLDVISPMAFSQSPDDIVIGSEIRGEWEIKNGKLYLNFFDSMELLNAERISFSDKEYLISELSKYFLKDYKKLGMQGLPYEIKENNGKYQLTIHFGNVSKSFVKREEK